MAVVGAETTVSSEAGVAHREAMLAVIDTSGALVPGSLLARGGSW